MYLNKLLWKKAIEKTNSSIISQSNTVKIFAWKLNIGCLKNRNTENRSFYGFSFNREPFEGSLKKISSYTLCKMRNI